MIFEFWRNTVGKVAGCMPVPASSWLVIKACAACCSPANGNQILRSTEGSGARLRLAAHQLGRRSNTFCCGEASATCQGPVVIGHCLARSKCLNVVQSCPSKMCFGTMYTPISYL